MGRPRVVHECAGCGKPTPRRGRATDGVRCIDCSIQRHVDATLQIRYGFGEFYEKWVRNLTAAMVKKQAEMDSEMGAPAERTGE